MSAFSVSVVIRNRNDAAFLQQVLNALRYQKDEPFEIIVVDNASSDESVKIAMQAGARVIPITEEQFTYGRALNIGLRETSGDICVLLSAHSLPVGQYFLREAAAPFADEQIAAVRCLHIGKKRDLVRWMHPQRLVGDLDPYSVLKQGPVASACAIRRRVWEEIQFDEQLEASEDKDWMLRVLQRGYAVQSPCAAVYFYMKKRSLLEAARKRHRENLAHYRIFQRSHFKPNIVLLKLMEALFISAPRAAAQTAIQAIVTSYYQLRLPIDARKEPRKGSIY